MVCLRQAIEHGRYLRPAADIILPKPEVFTLARIDGGGLSTPQSGRFRIASPLYLSPPLRIGTPRSRYRISSATSYGSSVHHAPSAFCVYDILWTQPGHDCGCSGNVMYGPIQPSGMDHPPYGAKRRGCRFSPAALRSLWDLWLQMIP